MRRCLPLHISILLPAGTALIATAHAAVLDVSTARDGSITVLSVVFSFLESPVKYYAAAALILIGAYICHSALNGATSRGRFQTSAEISAKISEVRSFSARLGFRPLALALGVLLVLVGALICIADVVSGAVI